MAGLPGPEFRVFQSAVKCVVESKTMLQKCCRYDELYSYVDEECVSINSSLAFSGDHPADPRPDPADFEIRHGLKCDSSKLTITFAYLRAFTRITQFFENGSVNTLLGRKERPMHFEMGEYCLDVEKEMLWPLLLTCRPAKAHVGCSPWFAFVFYVSVLLWLAAFGLYLAMPELRKRVYDKCSVGFLGSGALSFLLIVLRTSIGPSIRYRFISLVCIYYVVMVSYGWLHVMCIHLWRTVTSSTKAISGRCIYVYALYAFGLPVICGIAFYIDLCSNGLEVFLHRYLWGDFKSDPLLLYFIHICAVQQVINLGLFVHVAYLIWYQKQPWIKNSDNCCQKHVGQQKTVISRLIRLSVLMGMDWMNIFLLNYVNSRTDLSNIFYLFFHINLCPGYIIFPTFVCCNEQVIDLLQKKFPQSLKVASFATKVLFFSVLVAFIKFVSDRWGKVGQNILVL